MSRLIPSKLHVRFEQEELEKGEFSFPRRYTLTHSDATGDLYLTVGREYDLKQISGWYTRLMRDEVLAEWLVGEGGYTLRVYCHVSGGLVFGPTGWRYQIFQQHLKMVLEALRYGDRNLFSTNPDLDRSPVVAQFSARQKKYNLIEDWGFIGDYSLA